ncbi:hypothetical protein PG985_000965 [Apiospora marii]|uniref:Uncharacterized protein n=1 Tax=Apiospora marii TaxID=335849 RepID=A0ABR1RGL2_9PEZI
MGTAPDALASFGDSMGTCRVPRSYAERPAFVERGGCRDASSVVASQPKAPRQPDERLRFMTGRIKAGQSEELGQANMISFDPAVEVIHLPSTAPNRGRRRQEAFRERDASSTVPPRAPEIERLSTPDFDLPASSAPSSGQPFCACCTGSEPHQCPSSRQTKWEAQSKLPFPS